MATSLLFMVLIAVAGTSLLSISLIHQLDMARGGVDVRLLIAAEAALESKRGQFILVAGVQEDWTELLPTTGWNDIGPKFTVNGIVVQVQGMPLSQTRFPIARLRGLAYGQDRTKAVEYTIRASSFADYALYFGAGSGVNIEEYTKIYGPYYSKGDINLNNGPGIEFFGHVETSGKVQGIVDAVYNFKQGYLDYVPVIDLPPVGPSMTLMRNAALASGTFFYANTISIELAGTQFVRRYRYRTGPGSNDYVLAPPQTLDIPDNSVIYISNATCPAGVDSFDPGILNSFSSPAVSTWGLLDTRRVTIACEHDIYVTNDVMYGTLLLNPDLRRYSNKESAAALNFREMLGVVSQANVFFEKTVDWTPLPPTSMVTDNAGLDPPDTGHLPKQYALDGVFMGFNKSERGSIGSSFNMELWVVGGIITGTQNSTFLKENFDRRNYATDNRIQLDPPPFFPRAYGGIPKPVPGSWRTYDV